ncbi:MAG: hypothetical protein FWG55_07525, partial [Candidatus Bathyarchaeota archaeon]|nr:hypothetical protein [Candidatus Termiticorpusculum sp.]
SHDRTVRVWKKSKVDDKFVPVDILEGHTDYVRSVCYSPDGLHIASASYDRTVRVWKKSKVDDKFVPVDILEGHTDYVNCVCYSPDGLHIASASDDGTIRIWENNSKCVKILDRTHGGHTDCVRSVWYNTDGKYLVSASADNTIKIWNIEFLELIRTIHPLPYMKVSGADLRNINCDELTNKDISILEQNGAITV